MKLSWGVFYQVRCLLCWCFLHHWVALDLHDKATSPHFLGLMTEGNFFICCTILPSLEFYVRDISGPQELVVSQLGIVLEILLPELHS